MAKDKDDKAEGEGLTGEARGLISAAVVDVLTAYDEYRDARVRAGDVPDGEALVAAARARLEVAIDVAAPKVRDLFAPQDPAQRPGTVRK